MPAFIEKENEVNLVPGSLFETARSFQLIGQLYIEDVPTMLERNIIRELIWYFN